MLKIAAIILATALPACSSEPKKKKKAAPAQQQQQQQPQNANQIPVQPQQSGNDGLIGDINNQKNNSDSANPLSAIMKLLGPLLGQGGSGGGANPLSSLLQSFMGGGQGGAGGQLDPNMLQNLNPQMLSQLTNLLNQQGGGLNIQSLLSMLPKLGQGAAGLVETGEDRFLSLAAISGALPINSRADLSCVGPTKHVYGILSLRLRKGNETKYASLVLDCDQFKLSAKGLDDGAYEMLVSFKGQNGKESRSKSTLEVENGSIISGGF